MTWCHLPRGALKTLGDRGLCPWQEGHSLQAPPPLLLPGTREPRRDPPPGRLALVFPAQAPAKK